MFKRLAVGVAMAAALVLGGSGPASAVIDPEDLADLEWSDIDITEIDFCSDNGIQWHNPTPIPGSNEDCYEAPHEPDEIYYHHAMDVLVVPDSDRDAVYYYTFEDPDGIIDANGVNIAPGVIYPKVYFKILDLVSDIEPQPTPDPIVFTEPEPEPSPSSNPTSTSVDMGDMGDSTSEGGMPWWSMGLIGIFVVAVIIAIIVRRT